MMTGKIGVPFDPAQTMSRVVAPVTAVIALQWQTLPHTRKGWFADVRTDDMRGRWMIKKSTVRRGEWLLLFNNDQRGHSRDPDELKRLARDTINWKPAEA